MHSPPSPPDVISLQPLAIQAAKNRDWTQAIKLNTQILDLEPNNLPAIKRLAYAYSNTQNYPAALKLYRQALQLDKNDPIAKANITKLAHLTSDHIDCPCPAAAATNLSHHFLKVNEKTATVQLIKITQKPIWHHLSPGVPIDITSSRNGLSAYLAHTGQYIGRVRQDSISPTLCKKIIKGRYQAIIQCPDPEQIQILIRY